MSQHDNIKLEDRLRDELKDASFLPPPAAWDRIEAALPGGHPWYVRHRWPVSAAVLLIAFFSTYYFHQAFISSTGIMAEGNVTEAPTTEVAALSPQKATMGLPSGRELDERTYSERPSTMSVDASNVNTQNAAASSIQQKNTGKQSKSTFASDAAAGANKANVANKKQAVTKTPKASSESRSSNIRPTGMELTKPFPAQESKRDIGEIASASEAVTIGYQPPMLALERIEYVDDESKFTIKSPVSSKSKKQKKPFNIGKGFYMGPTFGMNYNFMSKAPIDKDADFSSLQYRPHFGSSFGLSFGYDFSTRFGVVVDWIYSSDEGQRFAQVVDGSPTELSIELDYMKFPVLLKYKHSFLSEHGKNPIVLNFTGGFHYSLLRSRNTFINGELAYFDQQHNQHQWGVLGGAEVDIYATKQLFFTIGARAGFNAGTEGFPRMKGPDGSNPIAFQSGAFARLNYRFSKAMGAEATKPQAFE